MMNFEGNHRNDFNVAFRVRGGEVSFALLIFCFFMRVASALLSSLGCVEVLALIMQFWFLTLEYIDTG